MPGEDTLRAIVHAELTQREEEGCAVEAARARVDAAGADETLLLAAYDALMALPVRDDFPYTEPDTLEAIRTARPRGNTPLPSMTVERDRGDWEDRFLGAWLGRCVGCALGKPLEDWPFMAGTAGALGWENVKRWFVGADAWPIADYVPGHSRAAEKHGLRLASSSHRSEREQIHFMESDDDIRYTVLGLLLLEEKGFDFDTWDVGQLWHRRLSFAQMCTAERQAYMNLTQVTARMEPGKPVDWDVTGAWVRMHLNPYREWIGAQIRVDGLAYGAASRPELAAELAWRDASLSHVKNGVYGAMFVAAMIAAAFVEDDTARIVEIGLGEIPWESRLAHAVRTAVQIAHNARDQEELVGRLWDTFGRYHAVHAINNAALVAATLIFARDDAARAITTAVLGGWDTDCNGATVGSIMGAKRGAAALPAAWTARLRDTLYAEIVGFHPIAITECARRSAAVFHRLRDTLPYG